jgi:Kef-type K+ transport system membrane component KefB
MHWEYYLVFGIVTLYKNRTTKYILIGVLLALLANVTIYAVVIACCIAGILVLDYFLYQQKNGKAMMQLAIGMVIFILGVAFSLYQIWPDKDNSFPASYAASLFEFSEMVAGVFKAFYYLHIHSTDTGKISGIVLFISKTLEQLLQETSAIG